MAYRLIFFCRSGEKDGLSALATFLSKLTKTGDLVLVKRPAADYAGEVNVCELATGNGSAMPTSGWVILHFSAGIETNAQRVIHASPDDEHGVWGSDLLAELTLTGNHHRLAAGEPDPGATDHLVVGHRLGRDVGVRGQR